jgi:hypothetical protein
MERGESHRSLPPTPTVLNRVFGGNFVRYHLAPKDPSLYALLNDENKRVRRSIWEDFLTHIFLPIYHQCVFYYCYYSAIWDDIMYTWDWGQYKGYDEEYTDAQFRRYTKGFDGIDSQPVYDAPNYPSRWD